MTSDCWFLYGINNSVHLLSTVSDLPVYYYHYAHRSPYTLATLMGAPIDLGIVRVLIQRFLWVLKSYHYKVLVIWTRFL